MTYTINKKDFKKYNNIKAFIENVEPHKNITPFQIRLLETLVTELLNQQQTETIDERVAYIFKKHKFKVEEQGIGWVIRV